MGQGLEYDPAANRATLTARGADWYLWIEWPGVPTAIPHLMTRAEVGDAVGEYRLAELETVIGYFERRLARLGYSTTREPGDPTDAWMAGWALAPGRM